MAAPSNRRVLLLSVFVASLTTATAGATVPVDAPVAARVAGEPIHLYEVVQAASSLALVGREGAGDKPGTRERILERLITARLLYLDAVDRELDESPLYREALARFANPILAARLLEAERSEEASDRSADRDQRRAALRAAEVARLERANPIVVLDDALCADDEQSPLATVARVGTGALSWTRVRDRASAVRDPEERRQIVRRIAEDQLLADEARRRGLDRDPGFRGLVDGFERREMVRLAREEVGERPPLDEAGLRRAYESHADWFTFPEQRRVQQIVVRTRAEAEEIEALLDDPSPGVTFNSLARDRSIDPTAGRTLGVLGWVTRDQGHPALAEAAFALEPGQRSDPIQTEAGFHVVRVLDRRPREVVPFDADTRERLRARLQADRVEEYARRLAEERYTVELFPEVYGLSKGSGPSE